MFKNYFKTAFRNLIKNKYYSIISVCGLGIAIGCFIFTYAYYENETSYDTYHKDSERIYRIIADTKIFEPVKLATTSELLSRELKKNSSNFEYEGAISSIGESVLKKDNIMFREKNLYYAEQDIINVFTIPFLLGDKNNALARPQTIVLTQSIAEKYFGISNPIGKELLVGNKNYEITGVVPNPPANTHFRYTALISYATIEPQLEYRDWTRFFNVTYVKLKQNTNLAAFEGLLYNIANDVKIVDPGSYLHHRLQPVTDIHTNTDIKWDIDAHTNKVYLYILLAVGILSLIMANINLINMSVSQAINRAKEIGVRKVNGASKLSIIYQFFVESLLILLLSAVLAVAFSLLFMPVFNNITEIDFSLSRMLKFNWIALMMFVIFAVSSVSCIYPALVISSVNPAMVMRKIFSSRFRGDRLKTGLMTVQYTVTAVLIMCFVIMMAQTKYMKSQYLGFDKDRKLVLQIPGTDADYDYLRKEFADCKTISSACASSAAMGGTVSFGSIPMPGEKPDSPNRKRVLHLFADDNFVKDYDLKILAGDKNRIFSNGLKNGMLVNEKFVQALGWRSNQEAVGQQLYVPWLDKNVDILGVVKDFHHAGLQFSIDPLLIYNDPARFRFLTLNVKGDEQETISFLRNKWAAVFPNAPFNYFFLDEYFNRNYNKDDKIVEVFSAFSWIGISIACFGLMGMTNYNIQRRIKEAGIRKVFGASIYSLLRVFTGKILFTIITAGIIASPIAYYFMDKWLSKYVYRIEMSVYYFAVSICAIIFISLALIIYPLFKAATANPTDSIKYE